MSRHIAGRGRVGASTPPAAAAPVTAQPDADEVPCDLSRPLTLGQFLKLADLIESGAEAKDAIASGAVTVDGEVDLRRGRKLVGGELVALGERRARVADRGAS